MKGSVISAITFAIAVAAVPSRGPKDKGSDIASNQCQSGSLQCCANADQVEYGGGFHFLDGFNLLNVEVACSPINVVGDITLNILGLDSEKDGSADCRHTVSCCNGKNCVPLGEDHSPK